MSTRYALKLDDGRVRIAEILEGKELANCIESLPQAEQDEIVSTTQILDSALPVSRNYRNAWYFDEGGSDKVEINLNKAILQHEDHIIRIAKERVEKDMFGNQDFTTVQSELDALNLDAATTLNELYQKWPASIETRQDARAYKVHDDE